MGGLLYPIVMVSITEGEFPPEMMDLMHVDITNHPFTPFGWFVRADF